MAYDIESIKKQLEEATNRPGFYTDFTDVDPTVLHQVSELTQMIRTKAKGSDILEVIAQLFERGMLEGAREGNANMEVAMARGSANTLGDRLDNMTTRISSIAEGSPKGTYTNLAALQSAKPNGDKGIYVTTDNGHWYYYNSGWKDGGVYQTAITPDVDYNDLDNYAINDISEWIEIHNKMHNNQNIDNIPGYPVFSSEGGSIGSTIIGSGSQNYWYQKIFKVSEGEAYSVRLQKNSSANYFVYFLDSSDTVIGRAIQGINQNVPPRQYNISIPRGCSKVLALSFESGLVVYKGLSKTKLIGYSLTSLDGKYERGTSKNGVFSELKRRVTTKEIIKYSSEVLLRITKPGFLMFVHTFLEDGALASDLGLGVEFTIPKNTNFRVTIQTTSDSDNEADVTTFYNAVSCYIKDEANFQTKNSSARQRFISNSQNQKSLYGFLRSSISKRYPLRDVADFGKEGFQSCAIDKESGVFYKFGWFDNASKAIKYRLSDGKELERITKPDTGHDNDAVFINGNVYIAGADTRTEDGARSLFKWNISSNTVDKLDTSFIASPNNGSWRCVVGVCQYENKESLYVVTTDHDYTLQFDGVHKYGDMLSVYYYDPATKSNYLAWQMPWDELYVQGATCINDIMYIACNKQRLPNGTYTGITIKIIDLVARMQVDEIEIIGDFEPESINYVEQNDKLELLMGLAKYDKLSKLVRFTLF